MLNMRNLVVDNTTVSGPETGQGVTAGNAGTGRFGRVKKFKGQMDIKAASYLRLCATKNAVNRFSDYHYLIMAVQQSTAPVNDIDYIHPVVKPVVDYSSAVITKGLCPNGQIDFEFTPDNEDDTVASRQATDMVSRILNSMNDPHKFLREWVMDACMHKNGMMMVLPVREKITLYREIEGTLDQLQAFEVQADESGLKAVRQSRRKMNIDMKKVMAEMQGVGQEIEQKQSEQDLQNHLSSLQSAIDDEEIYEEDQIIGAEEEQTALNDSIGRNTIYKAKYKLTGYSFNIRMRHIAQHYWVCDPNVKEIQDQPFCGFYDPMTIQQALELYPDVDLEEFRRYAEYNQNGAFQAGSVLNNLAIHGRDSVPTMGIPVDSGSSADPDARHITIFTCWDRYDIDGDGELELIEIIYSGSYIISIKEVEFIPVANMNPKPLPGNFFGMSIAESVVPMQEYMTSMHRAEIQLGLLQTTARVGVNPAHVDFEEMMDGEAAIFILDSKFDPNTSVWQFPVPNGQIQFIEPAMNRMQQDTMAMVGMTTPQDTFNPDIMQPGNSGMKLQLAMGPNQLMQDDTVKNAGEGLKDAIWLVWRTLVQYGDDYGVKKLAQLFHHEKKAEFLDFKSYDDLNFCERKDIRVSLALGMNSDENAIARLDLIKAAQMELYQKVEAMTASGTLTPEMWVKIKRPYEDTLYALGVKDCDVYLPNDDEVKAMIQQGQEAAKQKGPSAEEQLYTSQAELNKAKSQESGASAQYKNAQSIEIEANLQGISAEKQLEYLNILEGHSAAGIK